MSCWAVQAICVVEFDEKHGQVIKMVVPAGALNATALQDIKMMAMPDCLQAGTKQQFQYHLRIREKENIECSHHCLNCFVSFKQSRDYNAARGFSQKSVVLVCRHPFTSLAYKTLKVLVAVIDTLPLPQPTLPSSAQGTSGNPVDLSRGTNDYYHDYVSAATCTANLQSTLEVAVGHMQAWPPCVADSDIALPFFGEMLSLCVPTLACYKDMGVETDRHTLLLQQQQQQQQAAGTSSSCSSSSGVQEQEEEESTPRPRSLYSNSKSSTYGLGGGAGMFAEDNNLVALLRPLGLLPHLWTLWELVTNGALFT